MKLKNLVVARSALGLIIILAAQCVLGVSSASANCVSVNDLAAITSGSGTYETCGGDDLSYHIPISGSFVFGGITYSSIYATNNSIITFGRPDSTYYTFPSTPSISLDSKDWMQDGFALEDGTYYTYYGSEGGRSDEFFKITVSGDSFRVDIAARPYATYASSLISGIPDGSPTRLILNFTRREDGTLIITSFSSDATDTALRNGCVLTEGATAISLEECGIFEVALAEALKTTELHINSLIATTPLIISQTKDAITCSSATLKYMVHGVEAVNANLSSQTYAIKVDGQVVAQKSTLESSASFDKKLLPTNGLATCSQVASQDGSQVTVEAEISTISGDAAKVRKAEIAKILTDYKIEVQNLMTVKLAHLAPGSTGSYREASEQWSAALFKAGVARDAAIAAAYAKEMKTISASGMAIILNP